MPRIAFVNGRFLRHRSATVHIEDRGYQLSDGVYEVVPVANGRLIDLDPHFDRLARSLAALSIPWPRTRATLEFILAEIVARNLIRDGSVYCQITRGVAPRAHKFPAPARSSIVVTGKKHLPPDAGFAAKGVAVVCMPDLRWKRRDIKSIGLLPNILAKQAAFEAGAFEAWLVDENDQVTEGSSTNAWIVTGGGDIVTRQAGPEVLSGVTRLMVLDIARLAGLPVIERPFSRQEAMNAAEAFLTSTSSYVLPVTRIDDRPVGAGKPGPITVKLRNLYLDHVAGQAAAQPSVLGAGA
jgi:D-alanine transaminase